MRSKLHRICVTSLTALSVFATATQVSATIDLTEDNEIVQDANVYETGNTDMMFGLDATDAPSNTIDIQPMDLLPDPEDPVYGSLTEPAPEPEPDAEGNIDLTGGEENEHHVGLTAAGTENGIERIRTGWTKTPEGKKYLLKDGTFATGIMEIKDHWYAFSDDGIAENGWFERDGQQMYALNDGYLADGIVELKDGLYAFADGYPRSGWLDYGALYFADANGKIQTGWFETTGRKYLAMDNGVIPTGWIISGDRTYYQTNLGVLTGVQMIDGEMRLFGESGALASGIITVNGIRYAADEDGHVCNGWVEVSNGRTYARNGKILTGWQTINGERYYFHENGIAATGFNTIDGKFALFTEDGVFVSRDSGQGFWDNDSVSLTYEGSLYEGETPNPEKLKATKINELFGNEENVNITVDGDVWTTPSYGDTTLTITAGESSSEITVKAVPVDHVEAIYTAPLYEGDLPLIQNVKVVAVYEDGTRKPVQEFTCDLPQVATETTDVKVCSDFGNATLSLTVKTGTELQASYNGFVREGEEIDPTNINVWSMVDGKRRYLTDVRVKAKQITEDTTVTVKTDEGKVKCVIPCTSIESMHVVGPLFAGETLNGKSINVRFADGSSKRLSPAEYDWNGMLVTAEEGTSTEEIMYLGRVYHVGVYAEANFRTAAVQYDNFQYATRTSLGIWTLTAYADTPEDQGPYVGKTASGAPLVEGRTVAVSSATMDRLGLVFGDKLEINGHIYTLEDHGGSAMYNKDWVDIFVSDPAREYDAAYNTPSEVFLLR